MIESNTTPSMGTRSQNQAAKESEVCSMKLVMLKMFENLTLNKNFVAKWQVQAYYLFGKPTFCSILFSVLLISRSRGSSSLSEADNVPGLVDSGAVGYMSVISSR